MKFVTTIIIGAGQAGTCHEQASHRPFHRPCVAGTGQDCQQLENRTLGFPATAHPQLAKPPARLSLHRQRSGWLYEHEAGWFLFSMVLPARSPHLFMKTRQCNRVNDASTDTSSRHHVAAGPVPRWFSPTAPARFHPFQKLLKPFLRQSDKCSRWNTRILNS